jgi:hypothetical protein
MGVQVRVDTVGGCQHDTSLSSQSYCKIPWNSK